MTANRPERKTRSSLDPDLIVPAIWHHLFCDVEIVDPVHLNPNVQEPIYRLLGDVPHVTLLPPLDYLPLVHLMKRADLVLTDSGGIQEETTYLNAPCLTLRANTERPVTIIEGTNELVTYENIEEKVDVILSGKWKQGRLPELWDGKTAQRIVNTLKRMEI